MNDDKKVLRVENGFFQKNVDHSCRDTSWQMMGGDIFECSLFTKVLVLGIFSFLVGCAAIPQESSQPEPGRIALDMSANFSKMAQNLPTRAYVFPPLLMDADGVPVEQYINTVTDDGELLWRAPSAVSEEIQKSIEQRLRTEEFQLVTFSDVQDMKSDHSILVVTPYYSKYWENTVGQKNEEIVHVVFLRLAGATFPMSLEPDQKMDVFNQELLGFYNPEDAELDVVKLGLAMAVKYIGKNEQWIFYPRLPSTN